MKLKTRYSGKFVLRLTPEMHRQLVQKASDFNLSLNEYCEVVLAKNVYGQGEYDDFIKRVRQIYEPKGLIAVVLFGSVARQTQTQSSDIDFLLVFDTDTAITRSLYRPFENEAESFIRKIEIHCVVLPQGLKNVSSFWLEISLDGQLLWQKDARTADLLNTLKMRISQNEFKKMSIHGHSYWKKVS